MSPFDILPNAEKPPVLNEAEGPNPASCDTEAKGKVCTRKECRRWKPFSDFYRDKGHKDGYASWCKLCQDGQVKRYRHLSEKEKERRRTYAREYAFRKRYGISVHEYQAMHDNQNGLCALCARPERKTVKGRLYKLAVDHDHETGKVRALLCHSCNNAIGALLDNPNLLRKAARYIELHREFRPHDG